MWVVVILVAGAWFAVPGPGLGGSDTPLPARPEQPPAQEAAERQRDVLLRDARTIGRSTAGRRIAVERVGGATARRKVLVVGCIHGTECAGIKVARMLPAGCPLPYADVRVVPNLNPDGYPRKSRLNARGVDLNRNFGAGWRPIGRAGDLQHSGSHPFSEPETRAARRLIEAYRPDVTIWFHQQAEPLVRAWGSSVPVARRYAAMAGLPFRRMPWMAGTAPNWQNHRFPGTASFVVELAPGPLSLREATRHASAVERIGGYRRVPLAAGWG
jgi:protein MpaA